MNEEEQNLVNKTERWINKEEEYCTNEDFKELLNILDKYVELYKTEKEKNIELIEGQIKTLEEILQPQLLKKYVSKDKIKERYEKLKHYDYIEIKELLKLLEE